VAGKRSERQGSHKLRGTLRHHDDDLMTAILKPAEYFRRLVTGDPATDTKRDFHNFEV
jgi:hypothetical protein